MWFPRSIITATRLPWSIKLELHISFALGACPRPDRGRLRGHSVLCMMFHQQISHFIHQVQRSPKPDPNLRCVSQNLVHGKSYLVKRNTEFLCCFLSMRIRDNEIESSLKGKEVSDHHLAGADTVRRIRKRGNYRKLNGCSHLLKRL